MPEFDPIKIFKRMWVMKWGGILVSSTIIMTALAIFSLVIDPSQKTAMVLSWGLAISLWVILIISYLGFTAKLRENLDGLMEKGEWIEARLTGDNEEDIDRWESLIQQWDESVIRILRDTEYYKSWRSNIGLSKPEDESRLVGLERFRVVYKNYMALRLSKLREIRDKL